MFLNDILNFGKKDLNNKNPNEDDEDFYSILGCNPNSTTEQILAEYRGRALQLHPDKVRSIEDKVERERKFCLLSKAKDVLTDITQRRNYDRWRESGLKISFRKFTSLSSQCHTSIHWINSNQKNQPKAITDSSMINQYDQKQHSSSSFSSTESSEINSIQLIRTDQTAPSAIGNQWQPSDQTSSDKILQMFRNYQI